MTPSVEGAQDALEQVALAAGSSSRRRCERIGIEHRARSLTSADPGWRLHGVARRTTAHEAPAVGKAGVESSDGFETNRPEAAATPRDGAAAATASAIFGDAGAGL